jgi:hypothetical protein
LTAASTARSNLCQPLASSSWFGFAMPPQLLSRIKPGIKYRLHFDNFNERPAVAQAIAECIAAWSRVECAYGYLFISLLQANERQGANLYASLESGKSKRDAIKALAVSRLHQQKLELLENLLNYTKSQQKVRDKIAHWVWGTAKELDDAMVLCDPKTLWDQSGINLATLSAVSHSETFCVISPVSNDSVYAYSTKELKRDAETFSSLAILVEKFPFFLAQEIGSQEYDALYRELSRDVRLETRKVHSRQEDQ